MKIFKCGRCKKASQDYFLRYQANKHFTIEISTKISSGLRLISFGCRFRSSGKAGAHSCNPNEVQQMSIGSVGSIQSPMHHNLSVHSQPSSVPVNEQNILSPIPPSDVSPPSMTPSVENNIDQKPDIQGSNINDKTDNSQPNTSIAEGSDTSKSFKTNNHQKQSDSQCKENLSLKRPALAIQDCENMTEDDSSVNQILYDYSTWDAWYALIYSLINLNLVMNSFLSLG